MKNLGLIDDQRTLDSGVSALADKIAELATIHHLVLVGPVSRTCEVFSRTVAFAHRHGTMSGHALLRVDLGQDRPSDFQQLLFINHLRKRFQSVKIFHSVDGFKTKAEAVWPLRDSQA